MSQLDDVQVPENKQPHSGAVEAEPKPAIGLVATEDNADAVARTILRAQKHGSEVFVTYAKSADCEAVDLARQLDATIVDPGNVSEYETVLATAADVDAEPALIYHEDPTLRIDYEATLEAMESDEFVVKSTTKTETETGDVVAGIPAYNEAGSIGDVVRNTLDFVDDVIVVDDGSQDETARRARGAGAIVVQHEENRGYGAALSTTFEEANERGVDHLVILDGDGQHDPADIPRLIERQDESGAEIVIGSRYVGEGSEDVPLYRRFGLGVINLLTNLSMGVFRKRSRIRDTQSGFRVYEQTAIENLAESEISDHMDASTDILYHGHHEGFEFDEVGVDIDYSVDDASSHHPIVHGWVLVQNLLRTIERDRPGTVLSVPGFLVAFVGVGFGYWTISNYLSTSTFPIGIAVVSVFLVLVGIFTCFTGIILHALNTHFDH